MCAIFLLERTSPEAAEIYQDVAVKAGPDMADACFGVDIYPKKPAAVVGGKHRVAVMRWGFSLAANGAGHSKVVFNARSENLMEKRMFRPILNNRCLVPATAFYDFTREHKRFKVRVPAAPLFYLAALWRAETDEKSVKEYRFTVLTADASPAIAGFHSRMPVVLTPDAAFEWLKIGDLSSLALPGTEPLEITGG